MRRIRSFTIPDGMTFREFKERLQARRQARRKPKSTYVELDWCVYSTKRHAPTMPTFDFDANVLVLPAEWAFRIIEPSKERSDQREA